MLAVSLEPHADEIAGARWRCCDVEQEFSAAAASAAAYGGWSTIYPVPKCVTCGLPMAIVIYPVTRVTPRELETHILTKTEQRAQTDTARRIAEMFAAHPERTLMPWGEYGGKPLEDVPSHELAKARAYYSTRKRGMLQRSKELVKAIDAALAAKKQGVDEFPRALLDPEDDGLPFED